MTIKTTFVVLALAAKVTMGQSNVLTLCDQQATSHCLTIKAPSTLGANTTWTWPSSDAVGALVSNGSGGLTFTPVGTMTSVATTSPILGGPSTSSLTISCPSCLTTVGSQTITGADTFTNGITVHGTGITAGTTNVIDNAGNGVFGSLTDAGFVHLVGIAPASTQCLQIDSGGVVLASGLPCGPTYTATSPVVVTGSVISCPTCAVTGVYLPLAGGTMTGNIAWGTDNVYSLGSSSVQATAVYGRAVQSRKFQMEDSSAGSGLFWYWHPTITGTTKELDLYDTSSSPVLTLLQQFSGVTTNKATLYMHWLPSAASTWDLGSATTPWNNGYVDTVRSTSGVYVGSTQVIDGSANASFNLLTVNSCPTCGPSVGIPPIVYAGPGGSISCSTCFTTIGSQSVAGTSTFANLTVNTSLLVGGTTGYQVTLGGMAWEPFYTTTASPSLGSSAHTFNAVYGVNFIGGDFTGGNVTASGALSVYGSPLFLGGIGTGHTSCLEMSSSGFVTGTALSCSGPWLSNADGIYYSTNRVAINFTPSSTSAALDVGGMIRADAFGIIPTTGEGLELAYGAGSPTGLAFVSSYNRGTAAWQRMTINASEITINNASGGTLLLGGSVYFTGITGSTQCLYVDSVGIVHGTGTSCGGGGGGGGVTSISTTSPIAGGTITTSGTISCPTCIVNSGNQTINGSLNIIGNITSPSSMSINTGGSGWTQFNSAEWFTLSDAQVALGDATHRFTSGYFYNIFLTSQLDLFSGTSAHSIFGTGEWGTTTDNVIQLGDSSHRFSAAYINAAVLTSATIGNLSVTGTCTGCGGGGGGAVTSVNATSPLTVTTTTGNVTVQCATCVTTAGASIGPSAFSSGLNINSGAYFVNFGVASGNEWQPGSDAQVVLGDSLHRFSWVYTQGMNVNFLVGLGTGNFAGTLSANGGLALKTVSSLPSCSGLVDGYMTYDNFSDHLYICKGGSVTIH